MTTKAMILSAAVLLTFNATAQDAKLGLLLNDGEELTYKVRWNFLRLGTVVVKTERHPTDSRRYIVSMNVFSNPDLPFVDIEEYNSCVITADNVMTREYLGMWRNGSSRTEIHMSYDDSTRAITYAERDLNVGQTLKEVVLSNAEPFVNGPSLFFFTRYVAGSVGRLSVATMVDGALGKTHLDFLPQREELEVVAIPYPVRVQRYAGMAEWQGGSSAGVSGEFTGWISDDSAAVILQAKVKVLLGSLTLELEKYHRPGWVPPASRNVVQR